MKYLVKNVTTGEETLCEKVGVNGFDYYISLNDIEKEATPCYCYNSIKNTWNNDIILYQGSMPMYHYIGFKKVIATTNPSLNLPMVIDEVEELAEIDTDKCPCYKYPNSDNGYYDHIEGFKSGYKQAKETYQFTKEDMVEFMLWVFNESFRNGTSGIEHEELLKIWQEQRIITIIVK